MDEPTDSGPDCQTTPAAEPPCPCGSRDHDPLRIGKRYSDNGACLGGLYVCPAESPAGLRGVL